MSMFGTIRKTLYAACLAGAVALGFNACSQTRPEPSTVVAGYGFTAKSVGYERFPNQKALYTDNDSAASGRARPDLDPKNAPQMRAINTAALGPSSTDGNIAQSAYFKSLEGDALGAEAALSQAKQQFGITAKVLWSEGWIRLNLGDFEGALVSWQVAETLHGGEPFWVPYSKAIALAGLNDMAAANRWWELAKITRRPALDTADSARRTFAYWRAPEKVLLEKVLAVQK
jgi:hypothetical protein